MKKLNIFSVMMIVATVALTLRLVDISSLSTPPSVAESAAPPKKFEQVGPPTAALKEETVTPATAASKDNIPPPVSSVYGEKAYSVAEIEVLQSLSKRRDELDKREQKMGQHEALLKAVEVEVDRKIAELNKIKSELISLLNKQKTVQDEQVSSLVRIYEGMKPKEAARIFDTLEMNVLLAVIAKMSERKSSPILASMDPEKARIVTIRLSEQHKLPDQPQDASSLLKTPSKTGP